jgi:predicted Zn finger-like uncharacterized protein
MIVTCPSCSANYRIKSDIINPNKGRVVKCSACGNHWRVFPELPELEKPNSSKNSQTPFKKTSNPLKPSKSSSFSWFLLILCFNIMMLGLIYCFRKEIVKFLPQTKRFYQIIGIDVTVTGISIVMPYLEKINHNDGHVSLLIQGSFLNSHLQNTLKIPPLKIILLNNSNMTIANFIKSDFNPDTLLPGGRTDFKYEILNLPKEAVDVRIEFEPE